MHKMSFLFLSWVLFSQRSGKCAAFRPRTQYTSSRRQELPVPDRAQTSRKTRFAVQQRNDCELIRSKSSFLTTLWQIPAEEAEISITTEQEAESQVSQILKGWNGIVTGKSIDSAKVRTFLFASPADLIGTLAMIPLLIEAFRTAVTGQFQQHAASYQLCVIASILCCFSHAQMSFDTPRDWRAPRLAEPRTVYEFSYLYLIPFSWLLWRITPTFPVSFECADTLMCSVLTLVTFYGFFYPFYGLRQFDQINGPLAPSSLDYQEKAKLLCTGNIAINGLACLFVPFAWSICLQGTEWWNRVQDLHPSQGAFLGVSVLVAILGDMSGNWLLRVKEFGIIRDYNAIVAMGIVSNFLLLLFPEILFNSFYIGGVSEIGFYWE
ncbi:hypothetical protein IV203_026313 [Nitzschia inconspicua]|uniref:Uncharacterized protein n=1 Tax=Nitzschia inconspicua TaxID=303405 RepID=A0A9K3PX43_9STRA|nr:hypothetical protein IV203_026313 [Nitzschia inconspicua]